jgi:hypothetical protein
MSRKSLPSGITTIGIDIGKNTFHLIGLDRRGALASQPNCAFLAHPSRSSAMMISLLSEKLLRITRGACLRSGGNSRCANLNTSSDRFHAAVAG